MLNHIALATVVCGLFATGAAHAQSAGVQEVAPGVRVIDGSKVEVLSIEVAAVETAVAETKSFRAVRKLLGGGKGIDSVGPGGTTVHMYKARDTASGKDVLVLLFVKGDKIVDHLIQ